jgi:hypothetical protein
VLRSNGFYLGRGVKHPIKNKMNLRLGPPPVLICDVEPMSMSCRSYNKETQSERASERGRASERALPRAESITVQRDYNRYQPSLLSLK